MGFELTYSHIIVSTRTCQKISQKPRIRSVFVNHMAMHLSAPYHLSHSEVLVISIPAICNWDTGYVKCVVTKGAAKSVWFGVALSPDNEWGRCGLTDWQTNGSQVGVPGHRRASASVIPCCPLLSYYIPHSTGVFSPSICEQSSRTFPWEHASFFSFYTLR